MPVETCHAIRSSAGIGYTSADEGQSRRDRNNLICGLHNWHDRIAPGINGSDNAEVLRAAHADLPRPPRKSVREAFPECLQMSGLRLASINAAT